MLEELEQSDIGFVLVGGYAISQFETRFSTDLDLVIAPDDYDEVVAFLEARGFERQADLEVPPEETIYNREIELFERTEGLPHPVGVDILVNGLGCRQTETEWSFDYLRTRDILPVVNDGASRTAGGIFAGLRHGLFSRVKHPALAVKQVYRWLCHTAVTPILAVRTWSYLLSHILRAVAIRVPD